ncbi:hypothetical protein COUCH_36925 [Couchioplanes caeruleus]|uniref:hypothetical protein n=1 Tax=Couchioplanes caeruleus TaxID=56438 RepID=UPI0020C06061|nr:hypothetical protein [Couchioplanes caeruleus]UQU64479.1 hypothetical protein COUCH_36925 [Couchioplanes caeruleus]
MTIVPWVAVAAATVFALLRTGTPPGDAGIYAAYLTVGVVLPGTLVHRAFRGSRGNLPEDLALGAATGLLVQLAGWALAAATGTQAWLRYWPLLMIGVFLAVPSLRRHWRIAEPRPLPARWHFAACGGVLLVLLWAAASWTSVPLPPADTVYYPDLMYHLALVHEMTRSMPFQVPQLAGETLRYHYLSDADMASAGMITGIAPATVLLRLWVVPVGAIGLLVVAALTRELTGKWWAGPLAGAVATVGVPLTLGGRVEAYGGSALAFNSPSQTYVVPLLALLVAIAADLVRGHRLGPAWFLVPPLALACAGSKASALPPLVAGLLAGVLAAPRRLPRIGAFTALVVAAMLGGMRLFAGGGAGTLGVQPLSLLRWIEPYADSLGQWDGVAPNGFLPPGVRGLDSGARWFVAWVVVWWLLMQAPRLLGVAGLGARGLRRDPAAWLLGGMTVAGTAAAWLLWHPSASQLYFFLGAAPFGAVLTTWLLADRARRWWVPVGGLLAGAGWQIWAPRVDPPVPTWWWRDWTWPLELPVLRALGLVAAAVVLSLALRRRIRPAVTALSAAVLGASLAAAVVGSGGVVRRDAYGPERPQPPTSRLLTAEEMAAALWLDEHAGADDVVATNVHCTPMNRAKPCDARAFWVAGLGGRRTLVESWAYSDAAVSANGVDGLKYVLQPPPDPVLFELNERVFAGADPVDVRTLHDAYGVRWLLADSRATEVSPRLAQLAALRLTSGPVTIYELR